LAQVAVLAPAQAADFLPEPLLQVRSGANVGVAKSGNVPAGSGIHADALDGWERTICV